MKTRNALLLLICAAFVTYGIFLLLGQGAVTEAVKGSDGPGAAKSKKRPPLTHPVRISQDLDGNLFVSDYSQRFIYTLDGSDFRIKKAFEVSGRPLGVAWGKGRLFVGNETTRSVEVFNTSGKMQYNLDGEVLKPTDIAFDGERGLVFVVDGYGKSVKVFDAKGPFLYVIPKEGVPQEGLVNPTGIALDPGRGEVVVSDFGDTIARIPAAIKVYDYDGIFRFKISGAVQGDFLFSRPQGLAVGPAGNVFMVDSMLGKVLVFDRTSGLGLKVLGSFGTEPGQLKLPLDVVVAPATGDVFVTNSRNDRVEAFRGGGLP